MPDPVAEDVLRSPSFMLLDYALFERGVRNLQSLSGGVSSVVLDAGHNVIRIGLGTLTERLDIPEVLQVVDHGRTGNLRFEIVPKADTQSVTEYDLRSLLAALHAKGYMWLDAGVDNIARYQGSIVIIDPDGIKKMDRSMLNDTASEFSKTTEDNTISFDAPSRNTSLEIRKKRARP